MDKILILIIVLILVLGILELIEKEKIQYNKETFNTNLLKYTPTFRRRYSHSFPNNPDNNTNISNIVPLENIKKHNSLPPNPYYNNIVNQRTISYNQFIEGGTINTSTVFAKNAGTPRVPAKLF
jgi:hypothetical protein